MYNRKSPAALHAVGLAVALAVAAVSVAPFPALAAEPASMKTTAVSRDGMTMLPFRRTMEDAGATVYYNSGDRSFYAELHGRRIWAPLYDMYAVVNGETVRMSRAPVIVQGVAYFAEDLFQMFFAGSPPDGPYTGRQYGSWSRKIGGLRFRLVYERGNPGRIGLVVRNVTSAPKTLTFGSGKTHEIVLRRNGAEVWSSSDGQSYTQAVQRVTIGAGQSKTYWTRLPRLPRGYYDVEAYFTAVSYEGPVAEMRIAVGSGQAVSWNDPLDYSLSFRTGWSGSQSPPRLVLTVRNNTGRDVVFPYPHSYEFVIWGNDGSVTRKKVPAMSVNDYVQQVAAGAVQTHFVYLHGLKKGSYYVEAYVREDGGGARMIGSLEFTVR
ncbi:MAG: BsuPI-related putative proteinase inhibitor [Firmicutes bacterium]|jgi:hypothetical protein|nr:BsuPI-related putative proteinase inhibitor [Bacillota bacterium]